MEHHSTSNNDETDAEQGQENQTEEGPLLCARCHETVTWQEALFQMGDPHQVFANPHGHVFDLVTAKEATGVILLGPPTTEFTWFAGYTWCVIVCAACQVHLGWGYQAIQAERAPSRFFGFLKERLTGF